MRDLGLIPDGAVLISAGRIEAVGQGRRIENLAAARRAHEIDARGKTILPGFVDCHAWPLWGQLRLPGDDLHAQAGARDLRTMEATAGFDSIATTPARSLERRLRLALEDYVRHGTTSVEAKTGSGLDPRGQLKSLRVFAGSAQLAVDLIPSLFADGLPARGHPHGVEEYLRTQIEEVLPEAARRRIIRFVEVCCGKGSLSGNEARRFLLAARSLGLHLKVQATSPSQPAARLTVELEAAAVVLPDLPTPDDIAALARSSAVAILTPAVTLQLGYGRGIMARSLIDQGVAVAVATGYHPYLNPNCNLQYVLWAACRHFGMTPAEAVTAATINAAHALKCGGLFGSIENGKSADLVLFDASDYRELAHCAGQNLVTTVIKRGRILYQRGEVQWQKL
ncbi:MAG: amidohydrolase family protein [Bryobacteraceae bacterium]